MADKAGFKIGHDPPKAVSRRDFIKGVIAGGAAVYSANFAAVIARKCREAVMFVKPFWASNI